MQTITLKVRNSNDIFLLTMLAERLGIYIVSNEDEVKSVTKNETRKWKFIGSLKLDNELDNINLRDFAHE